jgi:prepilin signal peptidase PulO-like enzyme (type II secretory pathway)
MNLGIFTILVVGIACGATGFITAKLARWRAYKQPSGSDIKAEEYVIATILANPNFYFEVGVLTSKDFTRPSYQLIWEFFENHATLSTDPDLANIATKHNLVPNILDFNSSELWTLLQEDLKSEKSFLSIGVGSYKLEFLETLDWLVAQSDDASLNIETKKSIRFGRKGENSSVVQLGGRRHADEYRLTKLKIIDAGSKILMSTEDRKLTGMSSILVANKESLAINDDLVQRVIPKIDTKKYIVVSLLLGIGGSLSWVLAGGGLLGLSAILLVSGSMIIALIDIDTMYVDYPTLVITAMLCYVSAGAGLALAGLGDLFFRFISTVAIVLTVTVVLDVVALLYKKIRKQVGLGGGDSAILLLTLSVPLLITGNPMVAILGLLAACVLALVGQIVLHKATISNYFAFGPYLAAGWLVGWTICSYFNIGVVI